MPLTEEVTGLLMTRKKCNGGLEWKNHCLLKTRLRKRELTDDNKATCRRRYQRARQKRQQRRPELVGLHGGSSYLIPGLQSKHLQRDVDQRTMMQTLGKANDEPSGVQESKSSTVSGSTSQSRIWDPTKQNTYARPHGVTQPCKPAICGAETGKISIPGQLREKVH
jgi:hypothetical protein